MNGLDLFAGSGIGSLALKHIIPNYKTVCYVEWEAYCQAILISRIKDGLLDDVPIWDDVRTFDGTKWRGKVDIVYGGFPCQPFSIAGKKRGADDERNCWPDTFRVISEVRPRFCFLENVPNLIVHPYSRQIFGDLASIGYDCEWDIVSARFSGSAILRKRIFILGWDSQLNAHRLSNEKGISPEINFRCPEFALDLQDVKTSFLVAEGFGDREIDDVAYRVERLKMLGNGWVPQVVARILKVDKM